jgi:hypothetical protein
MLTRPGSLPGPAWLRNLSDSCSDPERIRKVRLPFWAFFLLYMLGILLLTHFITAIALSKDHVYESAARVAGLPLFSSGPRAHGIVAFGAQATGVVALGGVAVGFLAIGGFAVGVFAMGGVSIGAFAVAGLAIGLRALGGVAIGQAALGALAIGKYAYAGNGVAYGSLEASGRQKEHLIG